MGGKSGSKIRPNVLAAKQDALNETALLRNAMMSRSGVSDPYGSTYLVDAAGNRVTPEMMQGATVEDFASWQQKTELDPRMAEMMSGLQERALSRMGGPEFDRAGFESAAFDRQMSLMQPQIDRGRAQIEERLAQQGIPIGSEAYNDEMNRFEAQTGEMVDRVAQGAIAQGAREYATDRGINTSELSQALAGTQGFRTPQMMATPMGGAVDIMGPSIAQAQQSQAANQAKKGGTTGLVGTLGSAALMAGGLGALGGLGGWGAASGGMSPGAATNIAMGATSDIRLKKNIKPKGEKNGHKWYSWEWKDEAKKLGLSGASEGVIANEVAEYMPEAVFEKDGYLHVNYSALGVA